MCQTVNGLTCSQLYCSVLCTLSAQGHTSPLNSLQIRDCFHGGSQELWTATGSAFYHRLLLSKEMPGTGQSAKFSNVGFNLLFLFQVVQVS